MDFEEAVAACIRAGNVAGLTTIGFGTDLLNQPLVCDPLVPTIPGKGAIPLVRRPRPVIYAILCHQLSVVEYLTELGADLTSPLYHGWSPIHYAIAVRDWEIALFILVREPNELDRATEHGATPLHIAISTGDFRSAAGLLGLGAAVNSANKNGNTALHIAMIHHHPRFAELLLAFGAEVNAENAQQQTPLAVANGRGNSSMADFLSEVAAGRPVQPIERLIGGEKIAKADARELGAQIEALGERLRVVEERLSAK
jgi:ankyrin repeat protein